MRLGLIVFGLLLMPFMGNEVQAEEMAESEVITELSTPMNPTAENRNDQRRLYHFNRGDVGKGYTRYYGRRASTGRATDRTRTYLKSQAKAAIESSVKMKSESQDMEMDVAVEKMEYNPVRYYHSNRFDRGYSRFNQYLHFRRNR